MLIYIIILQNLIDLSNLVTEFSQQLHVSIYPSYLVYGIREILIYLGLLSLGSAIYYAQIVVFNFIN